MKRTAVFLFLTFCVGTAFAQRDQYRRATMTGSRGDRGKCTIEVEVDGSAEVEIRGAEGRIRTLSGTPSNWRRFECSDALPRNPNDFRFKGIDGRGSQNLVRDPRQGGGVAIIRIDDPKGGREGYTFDIEWSGYSSGGGGGYGDRGRWGDRRDDRRDDRREDRFEGDRREDRFEGGRRGNREGAREAIETCKNAVRSKANSQYGVEGVNFTRAEIDDNPSRRDFINGSFSAHRGNRRSEFSFTCSVDLSTGEVRRVNVTPLDR